VPTVLVALNFAKVPKKRPKLRAKTIRERDGNLPPALTRSGRVELWLEMKLPDAEARTLILKRHIGELP
jgi:ATP-dependent 26S proteasome regulatory subunit